VTVERLRVFVPLDRRRPRLYSEGMEVQLTPEQEAFVQEALKTGRIHRAEEAVQEALWLWEKHERNRVEILAALDESEADLLAGRYSDYTEETLPQLADELKQEGREMRKRRSS